MKKTRGIGLVYRPKYRDKATGEPKESATWWIRYSHHGAKHRESSKSEVRKDASDLLKLRIGQAGMGKPVTAAIRRTTLDDLAGLVFDDYRDNEFDTLGARKTLSTTYASSSQVTVWRMTSRRGFRSTRSGAGNSPMAVRPSASTIVSTNNLHASAAQWRRSIENSQRCDMRTCWQLVARRPWSRPSPSSS